MKKIERLLNRHPDVIRIADHLLPELIKSFLRKVILEEKYPLPDPVIVKICDVEAQFWIDNPSDWYRIAKGEFEHDFAEDLCATISPTDVFLDVGSAQGLYSILAAQIGALVIAIDPDPISIASLNKNKAVNPEIVNRLNILHLALGNQEGMLEVNIDPKGVQAASIKKVNRQLSQVVRVPITTVDQLLLSGKIPIPTIVKIDVEGAEEMVIRGMKNLLNSDNKPSHLFIEFHQHFLPQFGSNLDSVKTLIKSHGYIPLTNAYNDRDKQFQHYIASTIRFPEVK